MRNEFAELYSICEQTLKNAQSAGRGLSKQEQADNKKRFARMDQITSMVNEETKGAMSAFGSDNVYVSNVHERLNPYASNGFNFDSPRLLSKSEKFSDIFGIKRPNVGIGELLRAAVCGARNSAERFAVDAASDNAGGLEIPTDAVVGMIDQARAQSLFITAGAMTIPLTGAKGRLLKLSDVVAPTFRAENSAVTIDQTLGVAELEPKSINVIVKVSRESFEDALNVDATIESAFASAFANEIDRVLGWGGGGSEPVGITETAGVLEHPHDGTIENYSPILNGVYQIQSKGFSPTAVIMSPRESKNFNGLTDLQEQPLRRPDSLVNLPFLVSPNVPISEVSPGDSSMIVGDFRNLWVAIRTGLRVEIIKERYVENNQYAFHCSMRVDSAVVQPKAFCAVTGIYG